MADRDKVNKVTGVVLRSLPGFTATSGRRVHNN